VRFDGIDIELSAARNEMLGNIPSTNIKVGIRPEFVHVCNKPTDGAYECDVQHVEDLGTYKILTLKLGEKIIKARLDEDHAVPQQKAYISFPEQWLKIYVDEYLIGEDLV
jgi:glycerol transport system ATP-binding protein